jgi:hypothetical protein
VQSNCFPTLQFNFDFIERNVCVHRPFNNPDREPAGDEFWATVHNFRAVMGKGNFPSLCGIFNRNWFFGVIRVGMV